MSLGRQLSGSVQSPGSQQLHFGTGGSCRRCRNRVIRRVCGRFFSTEEKTTPDSTVSMVPTMWGPPVISWFISWSIMVNSVNDNSVNSVNNNG